MKKNYSKITLWRYLTLPKFIDFFINNRISFSRTDTFEDKKEGIGNDFIELINIYKNEKEKYSQSSPHLPFVGIGNPIQGQFVKNLSNENITRLELLLSEQKKYFISCWFKAEHESMAMWSLYADNNGVAIKINAQTLIDSISKTMHFDQTNFNYDSVTYKIFSKMLPEFLEGGLDENKITLFYRKDSSYEHEKEFRLILFDENGAKQIPSKSVILQKTEINKFEIIAHPLMPEWQFANLKSICTGKVALENIKKSSLL